MKVKSILEPGTQSSIGWTTLKRLRLNRRPVERCELCAVELPSRHSHLFQIQARRIACACDGCALLFEGDAAANFRRIPRDVFYLGDLALEDLQWEALSIPIGLAFLFFNSASQRMTAMYPSPGGAIESLLSLDAWNQIASRSPRLQTMQPDVEALLVNRVTSPYEYYLAPIDRCYELTGLVRKQWSGFSASEELWREVGRFFAGLRDEAQVIHA
jgi:hypothetical protein